MKTEHTKGSWAYDADDRVIVKKDCFDIAFMSNDVTDEYARLITAAPDLLSALQRVLKDIPNVITLEGMSYVEEAISKAKGMDRVGVPQ